MIRHCAEIYSPTECHDLNSPSVRDEQWVFTDGNNETSRPGLPVLFDVIPLKCSHTASWFGWIKISDSLSCLEAAVRFTLHMEWIRCNFCIQNKQVTKYPPVSPRRDIFPYFPIASLCCASLAFQRRRSCVKQIIIRWNFAGCSKGSNLQINTLACYYIGQILRLYLIRFFHIVPKTNTSKLFLCLRLGLRQTFPTCYRKLFGCFNNETRKFHFK